MGGEFPPATKAAVVVPAPFPFKLFRPVFKFPPVYHAPRLMPAFHSSVNATAGGFRDPPKANADELLAPVAPNPCLAVFKSLVSVHIEPFQDSVKAEAPPGVSPPIPKAFVLSVPAPANLLAVFKSATSVQLVPFQDSVAAVAPGVSPP